MLRMASMPSLQEQNDCWPIFPDPRFVSRHRMPVSIHRPSMTGRARRMSLDRRPVYREIEISDYAHPGSISRYRKSISGDPFLIKRDEV